MIVKIQESRLLQSYLNVTGATGSSRGKGEVQAMTHPTYGIQISGGSFAWKPNRLVLMT